MITVPFSSPDITEEEIQEVADTLRSGWITTGPKTKEFERQIASICNTNRAVCLSSATACMEMTLRIMGIGVGDEVITTAYTYTATASAICHTGATLVLVDTLPGSYDMDSSQVRKAITAKTKAIVCVDLAGIIYNQYEEIYKIVEEKKTLFKPNTERQKSLGRIMVMADAAHAFGSMRKGKRSGEIADFTCFSFHAVKNLTTAEGGAVTWPPRIGLMGIDEEELYNEYMLLSLHGQSKDALAKTQLGAWEYDVVAPYYKCNMTDITAAIGLVQLRRYPEILKKRKKIIEKYNTGLKGLPIKVLNHYDKEQTSCGHLYMISITGKTREECNQIIMAMAEKKVVTNVHYKPLPLLTAYKNLGFNIEDYPHAYEQFAQEITLPLYNGLTEQQIEYTIEQIKKLL